MTPVGLIRYIAGICFICAGAYLLYSLYSQYKVDNIYTEATATAEYTTVTTEAVTEQTTLYTPPLNPDHSTLLGQNSDYIGWISACNDEISYPVVIGEDNEHYLTVGFDGKYNINGSIYMDYRCSKDFSGFQSVIYGHSMKNGSMFRRLINYKDKAYCESNPYIYIFAEGCVHCYKIFSVYVTDPDNGSIYLDTYNKEQREYIINDITSRSLYTVDTEVSADNNIISLATCDVTGGDKRVVVNATEVAQYKCD